MVVTTYGCIKNNASRSAFLYSVNNKRLGVPVVFNTGNTGSPRRLLFALCKKGLLLACVFYWNVLGYLWFLTRTQTEALFT